jgi:hypothetical protein
MPPAFVTVLKDLGIFLLFLLLCLILGMLYDY